MASVPCGDAAPGSVTSAMDSAISASIMAASTAAASAAAPAAASAATSAAVAAAAAAAILPRFLGPPALASSGACSCSGLARSRMVGAPPRSDDGAASGPARCSADRGSDAEESIAPSVAVATQLPLAS